MASALIDEVSKHVEFLGYHVKKLDEKTYAAEPLSRDITQPWFTFHHAKGGGVLSGRLFDF